VESSRGTLGSIEAMAFHLQTGHKSGFLESREGLNLAVKQSK
jgi:hypothetical protein